MNMRNRLPIAVLSLLWTLTVVASAGAATINGVDYAFFANKSILMEQGGFMRIQGNVAVNDPNGVLEIGAHNRIEGTATAHLIRRGTASLTDVCEFDVTSGPGVCTVETVLPGGTFPIVAWPSPNNGPLGPIPSAPVPCIPGTNVTVDAGSSPLDLPPGCYGRLRVNPERVLNLSAGVYFFTGEVRLRNKSIVNGGGATVNVVPASGVGSCCVIVTETGVDIRDVTINTLGSDTHPGTNSKFTNVILYAPDGEVHIRSNTVATNLEVVAQTIILEPIQVAIDQQVFCGCFTKATKNNSTVILSDGIQLDKTDAFFLKATCDPTGCPGAGCFEAPASGNATTVVLDTAAIPAGTYHVIARFVGSGSYCSEGTITLP